MKVKRQTVRKIMVTGGAGFIGSNFIRYVHDHHPEIELLNYDKLTYAGNLENLAGVEGNATSLSRAISRTRPGSMPPWPAWTWWSTLPPKPTWTVPSTNRRFYFDRCLRRVRPAGKHEKNGQVKLFVHVSTDEVYGSIASGFFNENSPLNPSSPYAASKAGGDRLAYSYYKTFGLPVLIARPANNYGPFQYPEKLIPFFITRALQDQTLPLYGDGSNCRDWLFVEDTVRGLLTLVEKGNPGRLTTWAPARNAATAT